MAGSIKESKENTPKIRNFGMGSRSSQQKTCNISETGQYKTKVAIDDQYEVAYALWISAKINDLG